MTFWLISLDWRFLVLNSDFGLPVLDEALGGGIPRGYVLLLEEDAGLSEDVLVTFFIARGLQNGESVFILNTDYPISTIKNLMSAQGIDATKYMDSGKLAFMNSFGDDEPTSEKTYATIHNVSDIREIHNYVKDYSEKNKSPAEFRGIIDSLSTIILSLDDPKSIFAFVRSQVILQKKCGGIILLTVHSKAHSARLVAALEHLVDGVIELRKEKYYRDWRSILQIKKMVGQEFSTREYSYVIREGKLVVE
jgi:KaiC/GvpD/RAD55 family RecA-like ATPase